MGPRLRGDDAGFLASFAPFKLELERANNSYDRDIPSEPAIMKTLAALLAIAALAAAATPASAKGCLKGAVVGGVAGHYAGHHGVLGAIAGCAYGRHRANEQDRGRQNTGTAPAPAGEKL
jgi:hypothetical protein